MPIVKYTMPKSVSSNREGYNVLAELAFVTSTLLNCLVKLDFSKTEFFDGNLCAVLGSIIDGMILRKNAIIMEELQPQIQNSLNKNKFLPTIMGSEDRSDNQGNTIYYSKFKVDDDIGIKNYIETELLNRAEMPILSDALKREIVIRIFEIYANALTHGQSENVYSCGQLSPRTNPPIINFTFVDLGKTIKNNVIEFLSRPMSGSETIIWATSDANTTKTDNHSGGIGLKLIKEFIQKNGGRFQIVSGDGFWEFSQNGVITDEMNNSFPGTIVNLIFNVSDVKKYYLASEITSAANIF